MAGVEAQRADAVERLEGSGVVLAQVGAESVDHLGLVPDRVLVGSGQDSDGLDEFAVGGQWPVGGHVGAKDVGQDAGISSVRLGSGAAAAVAVACGGQRVDRIHLPPGGLQTGHQQAARSLDSYGYRLVGAVAVADQQFQQGVEAGAVIADPQLGQLGAVLLHQRDVVVVLGPVDAAEDLVQPRSPICALRRCTGRLRAEHAAL